MHIRRPLVIKLCVYLLINSRLLKQLDRLIAQENVLNIRPLLNYVEFKMGNHKSLNSFKNRLLGIATIRKMCPGSWKHQEKFKWSR